jgi:hypothetical protein
MKGEREREKALQRGNYVLPPELKSNTLLEPKLSSLEQWKPKVWGKFDILIV